MQDSKNPFVSFVILTYNHADFVKDTLMGALSQDYPNMEIIVSDDASPDDTYSILEDLTKNIDSDKRVILNKNKQNMGLIPHLNFVLENLVHGEVVFLAGGDDISLSNRVSDTLSAFDADESVLAVTGQLIKIDKYGKEMSIQPTPYKGGIYSLCDEYIRTLTFMCGGAGLAFKKSVWDTFGPFLDICPTEDSTMRFRTLLMGNIYVSHSVFIKYRIHDNNLSRPANVYNLQTQGIVAQYERDLQLARNKNLISEDCAKRIEQKILLYNKNREYSAAKNGKVVFVKAIYKVLQFFVQKKIIKI